MTNEDPNTLIEQIFADFTVDGVEIPVAFLRYDGKDDTYVTYQQTDADTTFSADDDLLNYVDYYDFDVYSKGNYIKILQKLKTILTTNGFTWQPSRSSGDLFEDDTGYYHKTLCFSTERSTTHG